MRFCLALFCLFAALPAFADQRLYDFYYQHGLTHYRQYVSEAEAERYAARYAKQFADYYASRSYQEALRTALPTEATPALQAAAKNTPSSNMKMAEVGVDLIKHFEGLRLTPYRDAGGKMTIGYGHLLRPREAYTQITPAQAERLLMKDIVIAELFVKQLVKVPLSLSQYSALVALVYNIGAGQFEQSTLLRFINQGNYDAAAQQMLRWKFAKGKVLRGLAKRRTAEYLLFTGKWRK